MIDYVRGIPFVDVIAAAFPHKILEKISGTPSRIDIDNAQEKQTENVLNLFVIWDLQRMGLSTLIHFTFRGISVEQTNLPLS